MRYDKCPTCGMPIDNGDKLIAYYYAPKDWYVMVHTGPGPESTILNDGAMVLPNARIICQQARYETPMLIGQRQAQTGPG